MAWDEETRDRVYAWMESPGKLILNTDDIRAALDEIERLETVKFGSPCRCQSWIEATSMAEQRIAKLEAALRVASDELAKAWSPRGGRE